MTYEHAVDQLIDMLVSFGPGNDVLTNPWVDQDPELDRPNAPQLRQQNLRRYLRQCSDATFALVGQEAGYAGCRFTGIAFTSEDMFQGPKVRKFFDSQGYSPTSTFDRPMSERSAHFVWPVIGDSGRAVLWNSLPFHCHEAGRPLTNRAWKKADDRHGLAEVILRHFVEKLFPHATLIAVGRKAEKTLTSYGYEVITVRHPSQGGATLFRNQMANLLPAH